MNEIEGVVVRTENDHAWVRPSGAGGSACGSCSSRGSCGSARLSSGANPDGNLLRLPNPIRARAGDRVVIRAADGTLLKAVWHVYLMPLLLALIFAAALLELTGNEAIALLGVLIGLAGGFLALRFLRPGRQGTCDGQELSIGYKNF